MAERGIMAGLRPPGWCRWSVFCRWPAAGTRPTIDSEVV